MHAGAGLTIAPREHAHSTPTDADVGSFDAGDGSAHRAHQVGRELARETLLLGRTGNT